MAMNPMQRRARNSFLVGFLVAVIIMALVVVLLLYQMKGIKEERDNLKSAQSEVYVASKDLKSGELVTWEDCFKRETVRTKISSSEVISSSDFEFTDASGNPVTKIDEDGNELSKQLMMKIAVPAGTIVTKEMVEEVDDPTIDSQRVQEFNMIVLPSQLVNGDYIDIRLSMPNGQDYIVLSKKQVLGTEATSVWLKLSEDEILTLNNAIVEAYTITGSKLYAIQYVEPGLQSQATATYTVSQAVLNLISSNPNVTTEAWDALKARYNSEHRIQYFETAIDPNRENQQSLVSAGNASEVESIKAAREEFVESLEGTEDVGYTR